MEQITISEQHRLDELELAIDGGMQSFMEVGAALAEIRTNRLYRAQYATFGDYCRERWDFTASRGRQLIAAVEAIASLPEAAPKPRNAAQASALSEIEPEQRADTWDRARREAEDEGRPVTAQDIRRVAAEEKPQESEEPKTLGDTNMAEVLPVFKQALESLKTATDAAETLSKSNAKAWLLMSGSALLKHLRDARDHIRAARPAGLCPACGGSACVKCQDTGWVNKARLDAMTKK